jgi:hypothetical protein
MKNYEMIIYFQMTRLLLSEIIESFFFLLCVKITILIKKKIKYYSA